MAIDMASVYAERFRKNPDALRAAVLGQSPDPKLDSYTALNALRLVKEADMMDMAGKAQQPTSSPSILAQNLAPPAPSQGMAGMIPMGAPAGQMPQQRAPMPQPTMQAASGGLAGMYTSDEDYAEGGIVAFNIGGLNSGEGMEANAVTDDPYARFLTEGEGGGGGNAGLQTRAFDDSQETRQMIKNLTRGTTTAAEDDAAITRYMNQIDRYGGPDIYKAAIGRLDERESSRSKSSSQGQGLALLAAAGAILEGNTLARGASKAFPVFAKEMGEVQRADIAEQRSIESMRFALADAQRKERMGDIRGAQAARETARKEKADAATFELNKVSALATLDGKVLQATREANKGAGSGPKLAEQLAAAELAYAKNPTKENKADVDALSRAAAKTRTSFSTSENAPNKQEAALAPTIRAIDADVINKLGDFKDSDRAYRAAVRKKDTTEANRLLTLEENRLRAAYKTPEAAPAKPSAAPVAATPKPTAVSKAVSMADVRATVASSGRTEQEVIDALKAKGYTIK